MPRKKKLGSYPKMKNVDYMKPEKFRDHVTVNELARIVNKDPRWILKLEKANRIPKAVRFRMGMLPVRLWSPEQVDEIRVIFSKMRVGKPRGSKNTKRV
jgi:hypothetical protein